MRFCSAVGHALAQTARAIGPSTMERSRGLRGRAVVVTAESLLPPLGVEAPRPGAGGREVEKEKTEEDGGVPLIEHWPEALRRVADEIGDRHLAGEDEGHGPAEQSDQEEQAAKRLQDSGDAGQRRDRSGASAWHYGRRKRDQLGRPELHEEKGSNDPEDAEQEIGRASCRERV